MKETIENLIDEKKYSEVKKIIVNLENADIAEILEDTNNLVLIKIFRLLPKDIAAEVFALLDLYNQQIIIKSLTIKEAASIIDNMFADDATDLIEEMPASIVKRILANTTPETRRDINQLLLYPEDSAGSIMTIEFIDIKEHNTVKQAIQKIKKVGVEKETVDFCYIVDAQRKLLGTVSLKNLLFADDATLMTDIMEQYQGNINTHTDQEEVIRQFQKYDVTVMPVVDSENRLVGIITVDDIVDVIQQVTTEDIEMMAAITPTDKSYMKTGVFETWKKRIPWLLLLMVSATFTGRIIQSYEAALASCVILTSFIPMFMDTGGNAGGQASVTIIRGISLNEIEFGDWYKIAWKEFRVALLTGVTLASANLIKLLAFDHVSFNIAGVVCLTLIVTVIFAKIVGCLLPIFAKKIGFDPAVMASPFITTIVDAISLVVYFQIATMVLGI